MPYSFDQEYVHQLIAGDPNTERHFVDYFGRLLTIKLRARVRPDFVDDLRQETFLRVFQALRRNPGVTSPERLGAFVNSVCNGVILEMYRSHLRSGESEETRLGERDPESVTAEQRSQIREAFEALPKKDQQILRELFLEERSREDIARAHAVDPAYLRVLLHRAKQRFRASLGQAAFQHPVFADAGTPRGPEPRDPSLSNKIPPERKGPSRKGDDYERVRFTVYHPTGLNPEAWRTLFVYIHVPAAMPQIETDSRRLLGAHSHGGSTGSPTRIITRGTEITVVPSLPGCLFNPARLSVRWLEDWHRLDFRVQASHTVVDFAPGTAVNGKVAFYVGPILVGEVHVWTHVGFVSGLSTAPDQSRSEDPYDYVFVSYAREDEAIVDKLEKAYQALGIEYLRDVKKLRSGEKWSSALLQLMRQADIFQLCWSHHARSSKFVENEWRHALQRKQPSFIRPVYWEKPLPPPPSELRSFHFSYLDW